MARLPHFALPFAFIPIRGTWTIPVNEQDTPAEVGDCVELILRTEQGQRRTLPGFGRPPRIAFLTDREQIRVMLQQAVNEYEPRVRPMFERADIDWEDPGMARILALYELLIGERQ